MTQDTDSTGTIARRTLLGALGVATLGGLAAGALGLTGRGAAPAVEGTVAASATPTRTPAGTATSVPTMNHDQQAEAVVKAFPAKTQGAGLQELASRVVDGAREFELTWASGSNGRPRPARSSRRSRTAARSPDRSSASPRASACG